jgi:hypothetical protein
VYQLTGVFIQEEGFGELDGLNMHLFSIIFNNTKQKYFLCEKEDDYLSWVECIRKVIGYSNLNEEYQFLDTILGEGRFGIVRLAEHKTTKQKVAIKVVSKEHLNNTKSNSEMRSEIEILIICQHENIIKIYNVYENPYFIYISKYNRLIYSYGILQL